VIVRKTPNPHGWTTLPNQTLDDDALSFRARGVLAWLLSRPDGWETDSARMAKNGTRRAGARRADGREGRDAIRTALNELEAAGYIYRPRLQSEQGKWRTEVFVYDEARETPNSTAYPPVENPVEGSVESVWTSPSPKPGNPASVSQASITTTETHRYLTSQGDHTGIDGGPVENEESLTLSDADERTLRAAAAEQPQINLLALRARLAASAVAVSSTGCTLDEALAALRDAAEFIGREQRPTIDSVVQLVEITERRRARLDSVSPEAEG
jgi:hypothetical protein